MTHGGKRTGAGRKALPDKKRAISMKLDSEVIAYLATTANKTVTVETAIQNTKGYRTWKTAIESK